MKDVSRKAEETLGEFNQQDLANTVWAFAKLEMMEGALMKVASERTREILRELNPQNVANAIWAFAKLEMREEALVEVASTARLAPIPRSRRRRRRCSHVGIASQPGTNQARCAVPPRGDHHSTIQALQA